MKPVVPVKVFSLNNTFVELNAVFDSGSYFSIIRESKLPYKTIVLKQKLSFRTADKKGKLIVIGKTILDVKIGKKMIEAQFLVAPELGSEMLIGAQTMQSWDISIINKNGNTKIHVAHDLRDPEITEVD